MAFQVYPIPQTAPASAPASGTTGLSAITEMVGIDPVTTLNTMFIRVVKVGTACAPSGPPHPTIRLKAGGGDPVAVTMFPSTAPIYNGPGGTGTEVADATMEVEANDVYRIRAFILQAGSSWQIEIVNNDPGSSHGFAWVVADNDGQTRQPWIDIPTTLTYEVLTGQAVPLSLQVANVGTGPLTITDAVGFSPGAGFTLSTVPAPINPNACGSALITFTGPATPGASAATYTVTSGDTTAQLAAGHNRRVSLSASTRKLEVMLLLDASGSMNAKPNGDPIVALSDSRWSKAVTSTNQFLDLLKAFGAGAGRFGVARFPDPFTCPSSADIQVATDISTATVDAAKATLATNSPGDMTPMGHGIGRVMGTGAGSFGYFESSTASLSFNRRWLVLLSDGAHNCSPPAPTDFFGAGPTSFQGKKISVITVGFGDPGAAIYAPDHTLLTNIEVASGPTGQFLDAGADDLGMGLLKSFRAAITAGLSLDPTVDPTVVLNADTREVRRTIGITGYESKAAFVVNWGTANVDRVRVEVLTPNCELITPVVAKPDPHIDYAQDDRYKIYTFDADYLHNTASPRNPRHGDWTLIMTADHLEGADHETVEYEVIFQSRLNLRLSLDRIRYYAGDPMGLAATLTVDGLPIRGADVRCVLTAPGQSPANWLADLRVTASEMARAKETLGIGDANALAIKTMALRQRGETFVNVPVKGEVRLTDPDNDGVYQAVFPNTTVPGTYDFHVVASGVTPDGVAFRREKRLNVRVDVQPAAQFTIWDTIYRTQVVGGKPLVTAQVRVFPRDKYGNVYLVDPEVAVGFELTARNAEFAGPLTSALDGSYTRLLQFTDKEQPVVNLRLGDRDFTAERPILSPTGLVFADAVLAIRPGQEARKGANKHADTRQALGNVIGRDLEAFLSLGGFGSVTLGVRGQAVVTSGRDDDVTVFVRPDEELRSYRVEVLTVETKPRWVTIGESPGTTQSFGLAAARVKLASAVRVSDTSGRTRTNAMRESDSPGVSIFGVGFRATTTTQEPKV